MYQAHDGVGVKRRRSGHNQHTKANAASARHKAATSRAMRAQAGRERSDDMSDSAKKVSQFRLV